jgi:glycosyltransferase involved in cell wall biosynthesis
VQTGLTNGRGAPSVSIDQPRVSVIVNNHNYARFLPEAIESALGQSYDRCEVIVVDDGSTDDSRARIAAYGDRVVTVFKERGGQASALNAGFARSHGDIVVFLDADDVLLPDAVRRIVEAFVADDGLAKVQYRLEVVDESGRSLGRFIPAAHVALPNGDLRRAVLRYPDDLAWAAMSGNAFPAWVLRRIMPIPTTAFPDVGADVYLLNVAPLFGPVASLDAVGAHYRVHGKNAYHRDALDLRQIRRMIGWSEATHRAIHRFAADSDLLALGSASIGEQSLTLLAQRMISIRLDPAGHLVAGDTRCRLGAAGIAASVRRRDRSLKFRLLYAGWFAAMPFAPRPVARRLSRSFLFPEGGPVPVAT